MITINPEKIVYQRVSNTETNPTRIVRNANSSGEFIFRGGLALQAELGAQNVRQFGRFLRTPRGAKFIAQQALLQVSNPSRKKLEIKEGQPEVDSPYQTTQIYNAGAPILAKGLSQELTKLKPNRHINQDRFSGLNDTISDVKKGISKINEKVSDFTDRVYGRKAGGTQSNAVTYFANNEGKQHSLQVRYGGEPNELEKYPTRAAFKEGELEDNKPIKDFIKFRIRDAVNGKYIIFPALLSGITDNSSAETTSFSYIGRADSVYVYGGYTRSISFTVQIVAQNKKDIKVIWEKVNYAKGLVLPQYKEFFTTQGGQTDATRPVPPIVYLTLGDMFNNAPGFFTSVNLSIPENSTWELEEGLQVPHLCTLAFEFTYIGKQNPTMQSMHYDNISENNFGRDNG